MKSIASRDSGVFTSSEAWICKMQQSPKIAAPVGLPCDLRTLRGSRTFHAVNIHEAFYFCGFNLSHNPCDPCVYQLVTTYFIWIRSFCSSAPLRSSRLRNTARRKEKCRLTAKQGWQCFSRSRDGRLLPHFVWAQQPLFQFLHPKRTFGMFMLVNSHQPNVQEPRNI